MARSEPHLGELEFQVLKILWEHEPCTVQQVADLLNADRSYARTTVLTVIQRLHAKGFLKRRKEDGLFRYSTRQDRRSTMSGLVKRFVDSFLERSPLPLVAYLTESSELTAEQAAELRKLVDRWESQSEGKS